MFALSLTIWISKKHVDFCNKDATWNGSQLEKIKGTNLKEFGKFMNHSKNYNNHEKRGYHRLTDGSLDDENGRFITKYLRKD